MAYAIGFSPSARNDMKALTARQRGIVLDAMKRQLLYEPDVATRQRKPMTADKPGFTAPWELRVGELRVYHEVREAEGEVAILAVGLKRGDRALIGGTEVES